MFGILLKTYRREETWKLDILETIENFKNWFYALLFSSLFKLCTNNPAKQVGAVHQGSLAFSFQQQISLVFVLTFVFLTVFTLCFLSPACRGRWSPSLSVVLLHVKGVIFLSPLSQSARSQTSLGFSLQYVGFCWEISTFFYFYKNPHKIVIALYSTTVLAWNSHSWLQFHSS